MNDSTNPPGAATTTSWRRAIRPLVWWGIMILLIFAYLTHKRWSANTRIVFEPMFNGRRVSYETTASIDGNPVRSGQRVSIGYRLVVISHPQTKTFSKNLFVWYGDNDLGEILLERATGKLAVSVTPAASRLIIRGPEFSTVLTNSLGFNAPVPTDRYTVQALFKYWQKTEELTVSADVTSATKFAPRFGELHISANHPDVTYRLLDAKQRVVDSGQVPAMLNELPEGTYRLQTRRKKDEQETAVTLKSGLTNETRVEFAYGAVAIASDPPGATILCRGEVIGVTPAHIAELKTGAVRFTLRLEDYEEVDGAIDVVTTQTNSFHTNLVSRRYKQAMDRSRRLFEDREYGLAANAAQEALKHRAGDDTAAQILREATGMMHLNQGELLGQRENYAEAIKELNSSLGLLRNPAPAQSLLTNFTKLEAERAEREKKHQAELNEQEFQRQKTQGLAVVRGVRLDILEDIYGQWCQKLPNAQMYADHKLISTNSVQTIATPINNTMGATNPRFDVIKYEWPNENTFVSVSSQTVPGGTRMCVVVASEVQTNETHIRFKIFEYENPPDLRLLGGLLRISTQIGTTSQTSPAELNARAERFAARVKEGIKMVRDRLRTAAGIYTAPK